MIAVSVVAAITLVLAQASAESFTGTTKLSSVGGNANLSSVGGNTNLISAPQLEVSAPPSPSAHSEVSPSLSPSVHSFVGNFSSVGGNANLTSPPQVALPSPSTSVCSLQTGINYMGNDIASIAGVPASACCDRCQNHEGCQVFTWTPYNGGTCWLKNSQGAVEFDSTAQSGQVPSDRETCHLQQNVDLSGVDLSNTAGASADECCTKCTQKPGCVAFTWTQYDGGTCWLKSTVGDGRPSTGAVSGTVASRGSASHVQYRIRSGAETIHAVNLGSWLVAEADMSYNSVAWAGAENYSMSGEYITMQYLGHERGDKQFDEHRATWITEQDIAEIAAAGLNTVRVPVGFWIVNGDPSVTPSEQSRMYAPGALKYLDTLINVWAEKYNLAVMLSLHAHQGGQNYYRHCAPPIINQPLWGKSEDNLVNSVQFASVLAARYKESPAFLGMGLMNEPVNVLDEEMLLRYYDTAYQHIRDTGNDCILTIAPYITNQGDNMLGDVMLWPKYTNVWVEWHVYFKWGYEGWPQQQLLDAVQDYGDYHYSNWHGNYVFMGEWSLSTADDDLFSNPEQRQRFARMQLQAYKHAHSGWSFWSWRHDDETKEGTGSGWSLRQLLREQIISTTNWAQ